MMNLCAGINGTGYGVVATNILKELYRSNTEYSLFPIGSPNIQDEEARDAWNHGLRNAQSAFDADLPSLKIWHENNLADRYSNNFNSALTFWELDTLSADARNHINSLDHLFVASDWAYNLVKEQTDVSCSVIPMGVDREIFSPKPDAHMTYRFFTLGKTEVRKGHDIIFELFDKAFTPEDDVELWIKWDNPFFTKDEYKAFAKYYENSPMYKAGKVQFIQTETQEDVARFINQCDCGLFPTRAEGFGLGMLEAIACEKPVITTEYSAQQDFCRQAHLPMVPVRETEYAYDGKWFYGQGQWAKIGDAEKDCFVDLMRDYRDGDIKLNVPANIETCNKYKWSNTLEEITKVFQSSQK